MDYEFLTKQLAALTEDCPFLIANLSNTAALLWQILPKQSRRIGEVGNQKGAVLRQRCQLFC